jgi:hypothetical protein
MTEEEFLESVGGVQIVQGDEVTWNFGVAPATENSARAYHKADTLYSRFPNLEGKWDGGIVNHHALARKVLGKDLPAHQQPFGTCGSRAGSRGLELLQCILIANGTRASFKSVSHAWIYYLARREFNMLTPRGRNGQGDGVASGSVPPVMEKYGLLTREEAGDLKYAGPGSDDLAAQWGAGRIDPALKNKLEDEASDNPVTARVRVRSAQELADGLASGGVAICSDAQGYTMTRDKDGFCRGKGTWYHYHVRSGVYVTSKGRKGFVYDQSWGDNVPDGPRLEGFPGNCFAVDWDLQDTLCRKGQVDVIFAADLWDLEKGLVDIDWANLLS